MTSKYYDLDDILADGENIPCKFNITVPGLGYLSGDPEKPMQKDTTVDLPLWLAQILAVCGVLEDLDQSFVDLLPPEFISPKVINAIKSNSLEIDLHAIKSHFYKLVEKWATMFHDTELSAVAMQMVKERAYEINNYSANANKHLNYGFIHSLDEFERKLYKSTSESNKQMKLWINGD